MLTAQHPLLPVGLPWGRQCEGRDPSDCPLPSPPRAVVVVPPLCLQGDGEGVGMGRAQRAGGGKFFFFAPEEWSFRGTSAPLHTAKRNQSAAPGNEIPTRRRKKTRIPLPPHPQRKEERKEERKKERSKKKDGRKTENKKNKDKCKHAPRPPRRAPTAAVLTLLFCPDQCTMAWLCAESPVRAKVVLPSRSSSSPKRAAPEPPGSRPAAPPGPAVPRGLRPRRRRAEFRRPPACPR